MDGLETLAALRKTHPKLPVIMFSTMTQRGAKATLAALALGASDYVTKPANVGSVTAGIQRIRDELIPKIKALCGRTASIEKPAPTLPYKRQVKNPLSQISGPVFRPNVRRQHASMSSLLACRRVGHKH
jgi:two-component system chemotaxis response regulator CheB